MLVRYARQRRHDDLVELAAPARSTGWPRSSGETVNLGSHRGAVELLDQRDTRHYLGSTNWVGRRVPLHASVIGKVFLA